MQGEQHVQNSAMSMVRWRSRGGASGRLAKAANLNPRPPLLAVVSLSQALDVKLDHLQDGLHDTRGLLRIGIGEHLA